MKTTKPHRPLSKALAALLLVLSTISPAAFAKGGWNDVLLKKADNFELYVSRPEGRTGCAYVSFSVYWTVPTAQEITREDDVELIEDYIKPAMASVCPNIELWDLYHFTKGTPFFDEMGQEIAFSGRSYVFSRGRFISGVSATARARYSYKSYDDAIAGIKTTRQAADESRKSSEESRSENIGKPNLGMLSNKKGVASNQDDNHTEGGGPFTGKAAAYLNALYRNDLDAVDAMDKKFSRPFQQTANWIGQSGVADLYAALSGGMASGKDLSKNLSEATARISMASLLAVTYIVNYEHIYPLCMDASPLKYSQTTLSQTVRKNMLGWEVDRSPAVASTQYFNVNHRFKEIFDNVGSADFSRVVFSDKLFGDPNAVKLGEVMADFRRAMHDNKCDSRVMRQLEANMFAKYKDSANKMRALNRHKH